MEMQASNGESEQALLVCPSIDSSLPVTRRRLLIISTTLGIGHPRSWQSQYYRGVPSFGLHGLISVVLISYTALVAAPEKQHVKSSNSDLASCSFLLSQCSKQKIQYRSLFFKNKSKEKVFLAYNNKKHDLPWK